MREASTYNDPFYDKAELIIKIYTNLDNKLRQQTNARPVKYNEKHPEQEVVFRILSLVDPSKSDFRTFTKKAVLFTLGPNGHHSNCLHKYDQ